MCCLINRYLRFTFLLMLIVSGQIRAEKEVSTEGDLKKRADKLFSDENYETALPDYSRLLSLYPAETSYNYRYGVCLLMSGKERANAASFLENAAKDARVEEEVWYYLGKSYMNNNDFSRAKDAFYHYKTLANTSKQKKYEIDACIRNCESGLILIKQRRTVVIQKSEEVSRSNFYSNYYFEKAPGKIVGAAEQFLTPIDREKQKEPVMYMGNDKQKIFFASYGNSEETGKDIYLIRKSADNTWSEPQNVGSTINSSSDEDFAFLDRDGRTMYFSSKGHNSIGGYDIFKSVYNYNTRQWSNPENLGIPINTPGDDYLFVIDEDGKTATYATTAESAPKNISIRKIETPKGLIDLQTISGVFVPMDQKMRRDARITILNSSGDGIITSVHTDPVTGKYELSLAPGENYMIVVEGGGYLPHAELFELPAGLPDTGLRQVIRINKNEQAEELTLLNYFSATGSAEPTQSVTRSYSSKADSSSMMSVKINDQIVYVTAPKPAAPVSGESKDDASVSQNSTIDQGTDENVSTVVDSSGLPSIKLKARDKYDPTLQKGLTPEEIKQKEEEEARKKDIIEDENTPAKEFDTDVSNEELAKIAYDEANAIQIEADSLNNEVVSLREAAAEKENYSVIYKNKADALGVDRDSAASLRMQSNSYHSEAQNLLRQADEIAIAATAKDEEARSAMNEANEIFKNTASSTTASTAKRKKPVDANAKSSEPTSEQKNDSVNATENPVQPSHSLDEETALHRESEDKTQSSGKKEDEVVNVIIKGPSIPGMVEEEDSVAGRLETEAAAITDSSTAETDPEKNIPAADSVKTADTGKSEQVLSPDVTKQDVVSNEASEQSAQDNTEMPVTGNASEIVSPADENKTAATENKPESVSATEVAAAVDSSKTGNVNLTDVKPENTASENTSKEQMPDSGNVAMIPAAVTDSTVKPAATVAEEIQNSSALDSGKSNQAGSEEPVNETANVLKTDTTKVSTIQPESESEIASNVVPSGAVSSGNAVDTHSNSVVAKNDSGEAPKIDNPSILNSGGDMKNMPMPVKPEAVQLYREYQSMLKHSNDLTKQSLSMQEEISRLASCPKRDSLIRTSNEITLESIHEWQEGLKKIQEARKIDSGVEYKMNVNDYAANRERNMKADELAGKEKPAPDASTLEANATTSVPSEVKPETGVNNSGTTIENISAENESEANIDTLNPEYPKYVSLKADINKGQVETIDVFAEAIRLSKLASEERDKETALMDQARMEKDSAKKSDLIRQSFEHKAQAEKYESESREKFAEAQKHTNEVKGMKSELALLRARISKKPGQDNLVASSVSKPEAGISKADGRKVNTNKSKVTSGEGSAVMAKATGSESELSVNENEISRINVGKNEMDNFMRTVFSTDPKFSYSEKNPIPMNPDLPEGLVFKVQIGAFRNPLPSDKFKGIQPISGETTRPGWVRYCAGLFRAFEPANIVKKEVQKMGYKDAFVVAYYNGKRIELNDAYKKIRESQNVSAYKDESAKEVAMLRKINIGNEKSLLSEDNDVRSFYGKPLLPENNSAGSFTEYAVQVGVYKTSDVPVKLKSMSPLQYLRTSSNLYKFIFGRYNDHAMAESAKIYAINAGVKDAFIVPYRQGINVNQSAAATDVSAVRDASAMKLSRAADKSVKNTSSPNAEIEETVTAGGQVVYKVQIGAYKSDIPYNLVESYIAIMDKGITHKTDERGLHIFYVGNFSDYQRASVLLQEVLSKGVKDAFVVALRDGKRIPLTEEMKK